jgi:phage shock protein A
MRDKIGNRIIKFFSCLLTAALILTSAGRVCIADELEDKIAGMESEERQTQEMISNLEKQTKATKDSIAQLEQQKKATESNVNALKGQSDELKNEIEGAVILGQFVNPSIEVFNTISYQRSFEPGQSFALFHLLSSEFF